MHLCCRRMRGRYLNAKKESVRSAASRMHDLLRQGDRTDICSGESRIFAGKAAFSQSANKQMRNASFLIHVDFANLPTFHARSPPGRAGTASTNVIHIEQLHKDYRVGSRTVSALNNVNLHIPRGKIFGIIGRSGAGKSTLLRTFNLLERPTRGAVRINGADITTLGKAELDRMRQQIGMVFQNFSLLSAKTVGANVEFPLKLAGGHSKEERNRRVDELLELVGLSEHKDKYPAQLSGGQKQRVGIARAIANAPQLLLCDEATSALDPETTQSILALLAEINQRLGLTIVLITHEMQVIRSICDNVAVIEAGEIVETGPVADVFLHPRHAVTRRLVAEYTHDDFDLAGGGAASGRRLRLTYTGEAAYQPILTRVVEQTRAQITILQGAVSRIKDKPYGQLLVEIGGADEEAAAVLDLFRRLDVHCEVIN